MAGSRKALWLVIFLVVVPGMAILKETVRPYLWLFVSDWFHPPAKPIYAKMADGFAVELHGSSRPHVGKLAGLQKGLILYDAGQSLLGEGYGFGLPIVHRAGVPWLASTAQVGRFTHGDTTILSKIYTLDTIELPTKFMRRQYKRQPKLASIRVDYYLIGNTIEVRADLRGLKITPDDRLFFMNEQSGRAFQYALKTDSSKVELLAWEAMSSSVLGMRAPRLGINFWIATDAGWMKYLGREIVSQWAWYGHVTIDWAGCDILVDTPPSRFEYKIILEKTPPDRPHSWLE